MFIYLFRSNTCRFYIWLFVLGCFLAVLICFRLRFLFFSCSNQEFRRPVKKEGEFPARFSLNSFCFSPTWERSVWTGCSFIAEGCFAQRLGGGDAFFRVSVFVVVTLGVLFCVEYRALQEDGWQVGQGVE